MSPQQLLEQYYISKGTTLIKEWAKPYRKQGLSQIESEKRAGVQIGQMKGVLADEAQRLGLITSQQRDVAFATSPETGAGMEARGLITTAQKEAEAERNQQINEVKVKMKWDEPQIKSFYNWTQKLSVLDLAMMFNFAIRNRLQVFSTLMEAYEGMKK